MLRCNFCLPSSRFAVALLVAGLTSFFPGMGIGSPVDVPVSIHDPLTDLWRIDLSALPAALHTSPLVAPQESKLPPPRESQPGCEWNFTPNTSPHPGLIGEHNWPDLAIAPDGSTVLGWMDSHLDGAYHIFYATSTDRGVTWSAPERVDPTGEASRFISVEITGSGIPVAVWEDGSDGTYDIYLSKRDPENDGTPWTPPLQINTTGSPPFDYAMHPSLTILDDLRFFVAWTDWREGPLNQVYMRSTADGGSTWGPETRISDGLGYQPVAANPCLIVDPTSGPEPGTEILNCVTDDWRGNVAGGRYPNVFFYRSTDGGAHWTVGVQVNDIEPRYQTVSPRAMVRLPDGTLTVAWFHWVDSPPQFRAAVSTDLGQTWSPSVQGDPGGFSSGVVISGVDDWVFASFSIREVDLNAYVRASSDGGRTWVEPACRIDDSPSGDAHAPVTIPYSPNEIQAAWWDNRPGLASWKVFTTRGTRGSAAIPDPGAQSAATTQGRTLVAVPNPSLCTAPVQIGIRDGVSGELIPYHELDGTGFRYGVYDFAGRRLRILDEAGRLDIWDGTDAAGRLVPPGVYWVRFEPDSREERTKVSEDAARVVRLR